MMLALAHRWPHAPGGYVLSAEGECGYSLDIIGGGEIG